MPSPLGRLVAKLRSRPVDTPPEASAPPRLEQTFSRIYADGVWTDAIPGMPRSGRGALYEESVAVADLVRELVDAGEIGSVVDVGCGDLTWISRVEAVTEGAVSYLGIDIVPSLIDEHRKLPWGRFEVGDLTAPGYRVDGDLVLVKDMLFHLTDEQVQPALDNLAASSWKLLLITCSDTPTNEGRVFDRWHFAPLDVTKPPYSLKPCRRLARPVGGCFALFEPEALDGRRAG